MVMEFQNHKSNNGNKSIKTGKVRLSLQVEITLILFLLTAVTILAIWLADSFFLEKFYVREKETALSKAYVSLNNAASNNTISSSEFDAELIKTAVKDNIGIIVMNEESQVVKYYASDINTMMHRIWDNLLEKTGDLPENFSKDDTRWTDDKQQFFIVKTLDNEIDQRSQIVLDKKTGTEYIEMWGVLSDGSYYLMRTGLESIVNSSAIASRFVLYVGAVVIVCGLLISLYLGRKITSPILQLTDISKRMKNLDFSAKYSGNDRTEIAQLGENINDLSETLERTIADLKTSNNELKQDIANREKTEAMQREFISNVTHELKTPIALIQGYAEGLQDGVADDEESQRFYLDTIVDEAGKMNGMVQKLLTLTHLEFGSNEVSFERFDIVQVLKEYLQSAELLANTRDITVKMDEKGPLYVWADTFLTEEVFQNYFSNAVNHCEGEKVIDIKCERKENCVRICVFNTGKPIPEDSLPRIWDKFYKVDKARTRAYGGSGVGLSIVKAIMELMHQEYGVINYDNGVEFWFELDAKE